MIINHGMEQAYTLDSLSPLTGVANISQVVGPETGEQSLEEGRGINKNKQAMTSLQKMADKGS